MNTRSWDSLEPEEGGLPYKEPTPQHVCGLQGYNGMIDPPCPGCEARTNPQPQEPTVSDLLTAKGINPADADLSDIAKAVGLDPVARTIGPVTNTGYSYIVALNRGIPASANLYSADTVAALTKERDDLRKKWGTECEQHDYQIAALQAELAEAKRKITSLEAELNDQDLHNQVTYSHTVEKLQAENAELRKNYDELLFHVSHKFTNETRHQTALRYIKNAEHVVCAIDTAMKEGK